MARKTSRKPKLSDTCRRLAEFFHAESPAGWKPSFAFKRQARLRGGGHTWEVDFSIIAGDVYGAEFESRVVAFEWAGDSRPPTATHRSARVSDLGRVFERTLQRLGYERGFDTKIFSGPLVGHFSKRLDSVTAVGREIEALESLRFGKGIVVERSKPSRVRRGRGVGSGK